MTATNPLHIRAGDLIEGTTVSTKPRTIRVRVDREPWLIGERRDTVLSDGVGVVTVQTDTLRLIEQAEIATQPAMPASETAQQLGDLAETLAALPVDNLPKVLQALSRVNAHLADFVAAAPSHFPHVTKRAAEQIRKASGELELALDAELNPGL